MNYVMLKDELLTFHCCSKVDNCR